MFITRSELGELTGFLIIGLFFLLGSRYILKTYFKLNAKKLDKNSTFYKVLVKGLALNKTFHPYVGYLTTVLILTHSYIQTGWNFFLDNEPITGYITGGLFLLNIFGGFIGEKVIKQPRPKWWLWFHRSLTILIGIAILIHINQ